MREFFGTAPQGKEGHLTGIFLTTLPLSDKSSRLPAGALRCSHKRRLCSARFFSRGSANYATSPSRAQWKYFWGRTTQTVLSPQPVPTKDCTTSKCPGKNQTRRGSSCIFALRPRQILQFPSPVRSSPLLSPFSLALTCSTPP